jgi:hypothetical protein
MLTHGNRTTAPVRSMAGRTLPRRFRSSAPRGRLRYGSACHRWSEPGSKPTSVHRHGRVAYSCSGGPELSTVGRHRERRDSSWGVPLNTRLWAQAMAPAGSAGTRPGRGGPDRCARHRTGGTVLPSWRAFCAACSTRTGSGPRRRGCTGRARRESRGTATGSAARTRWQPRSPWTSPRHPPVTYTGAGAGHSRCGVAAHQRSARLAGHQ